METVAVYRVEHADHGRGPFTNLFDLPGWLVNEVCDRIARLKNAVDDLDIQWGEVCGVTSPRGISAWFGYTVNGLLEHGYVLRCYHVPKDKVRFGEDQVAFHKQHAASFEDLTVERLMQIKREKYCGR